MVSYRDVGQILPVGMQMLLYISPIAYAVEAVPENIRPFFALNPLVGVLEGFRWALVEGQPLNTGYAVYREAVRRGALLRPIGDTMYLFPPLTVTPEEIDEMAAILADSLDAVVR